MQGAAAEGEVAGEGGEGGAGGGDEGVVDGCRHLVVEEGSFARGGEVADLGGGDVLLDGVGEGGGEGVFPFAVFAEEGREGVAAEGAVGGFEVGAVGAFGQGQGRGGGVGGGDGGEGEVGVGHQGIGFAGGGEDFGDAREEGLFGAAQDVGFVAEEFFETAAVGGEGRIILPGGDFVGGAGEEFRGDPCAGGGEFGVAGADAGFTGLGGGFGGVGVVGEVGVGVEFFEGAVEGFFGGKEGGDGGGAVEFALEGEDGREEVVETREVGLPGCVGGIQRGEVPGLGGGDVGAGGDGGGCGRFGCGLAHGLLLWNGWLAREFRESASTLARFPSDSKPRRPPGEWRVKSLQWQCGIHPSPRGASRKKGKTKTNGPRLRKG